MGADAVKLQTYRPGYGLHPKYYDKIIGKKSAKDLKMGDALRWEYVEL